MTANMFTGDASVLLNRGGRMFAEEVPYPTGVFSEGATVADVNADGLADILIAATGTPDVMGGVSVLLGNPAAPGSFAPASTVYEKSGAISLVAAPFDQDQHLDLAVVSFGLADNDVSVFLGHGDGSFDVAAAYGVGSWPVSVAAADLDSDGMLDLATANSSDGTVSVLRGLGDGTFASAVDFAVEGAPSGIVAADVDGDGHVDLAVCTQGPDAVQLLLNTAADVTTLRGDGDTYDQDFDQRLPADGNGTGSFLPAEWTAVTAATVQDTITAAFPPDWVSSDIYNAGPVDSSDRTLALGDGGDDAQGQLRLELEITAQDLRALSLSFDLEAWGGEPGLAANPGEAAFQVTLEVDEGSGFVPLADVGTVSTGATLTAPDPILMDGNAPANRVHFDSGVLDAQVAVGTTLAVAFTVPDGDVGTGFIYGVDNVRIQTLFAGDANGDGLFTSADMVQVFQTGEYEDNIVGNSTFAEGDWNGDGDFTSSDMVMAFQTGRYEAKSQANVREIAAAVDWLFAHRTVARKCSAIVA